MPRRDAAECAGEMRSQATDAALHTAGLEGTCGATHVCNAIQADFTCGPARQGVVPSGLHEVQPWQLQDDRADTALARGFEA